MKTGDIMYTFLIQSKGEYKKKQKKKPHRHLTCLTAGF